jgi:hypothetical protein
MAFSDFLQFFTGSPNKTKKLSTMTKEQEALFNQLLQMLGSQGGMGMAGQEATDYWRQFLDPNSEAFKAFEEPYRQQFEQETVPMLAEKFAGFGGGMGGGLSSSGFGQSLSAAGGNLQATLAALRGQLAQQAAGNLSGQYQNLMGQGLGAKPFGYLQQPGSQGLLGNAVSSWANAGFPGIG